MARAKMRSVSDFIACCTAVGAEFGATAMCGARDGLVMFVAVLVQRGCRAPAAKAICLREAALRVAEAFRDQTSAPPPRAFVLPCKNAKEKSLQGFEP